MLGLLTASLLAASGGASLDIAGAAQQVQPQVIEWRRTIHANPELSNSEYETAALVADHLRSLGLEVHTGIAKTGVIGVLRGAKPGRVVALRADMDALPVEERTGLPFASTVMREWEGEQVFAMHACGHDAHTAMLLGAASVLAPLRDEIAGTIVFLFQPAEEGAPSGERGGAAVVIENEVFRGLGVEAMFGLHVAPGPVGSIFYRPGPMMAGSDLFEIELTGKQTHGSTPWMGVDIASLGAEIVLAFNQLVARRTNVARSPTVLTVSTVNGGVRHNIIPETLTMTGTLRTFDPDMRLEVIEQASEAVAAISARYGATGTMAWETGTQVTANEAALAEAMRAPLASAASALDDSTDYIMSSEDFSNYAGVTRTFFYNLGIGDPPGINHSPFFDIDESAMVTGVHAHVATALAFLEAED